MTGTARITSAIATFQKPIPTIASRMAITARLGSERPMFDTLMARNAPLCRWPSQIPIGRAITAAMRKPAANSLSVWRQLSQSRSDQWSPMNLKALTKSFTPSRPCSGPRGEDTLEHRDERVRDEGEQGREHGGADQLRLERPAVDRVEDRRAEPLVDHERCDGREADHGYRRDLHSREDGRQCERQLHAKQRLASGEAHPPRRLAHVVGATAQPDQHVAEEDQQRVGDERYLDRETGEPTDRHEELEEREARDRVEEARGEHEGELEPRLPVCDQRARESDEAADPDREQRELDVLD